jgi:hypothetical protein
MRSRVANASIRSNKDCVQPRGTEDDCRGVEGRQKSIASNSISKLSHAKLPRLHEGKADHTNPDPRGHVLKSDPELPKD